VMVRKESSSPETPNRAMPEIWGDMRACRVMMVSASGQVFWLFGFQDSTPYVIHLFSHLFRLKRDTSVGKGAVLSVGWTVKDYCIQKKSNNSLDY